MATKVKHPLIKEIQLGKSPEELVGEHFVGYDFQGDVYDRLPDIVREIVRIGDEHLRFAVKLAYYKCEIIILSSSDLYLNYWDYDREVPLEDDARTDCEMLNQIVDRIYGTERKKGRPKITKEQFLRKKGRVCPYCGQKPEVLDDVTRSRSRFASRSSSSFYDRDIMGCKGCGETWEMTYKVVLTGFKGI